MTAKQATPGDFSITQTETLHQGWVRLQRLTVRFPDGETMVREVEDHGEAVTVLAYDDTRRTALLVSQFRVPPFLLDGLNETLEAIAGVIESGSADTCARREALEEAGVRLGDLEKVAVGWSMPGISTERMHFFLARYRLEDRITAGGGLAEEQEHITVVEMPLAGLASLIGSSAILDVKTLVLVQALMLRRPELFAG